MASVEALIENRDGFVDFGSWELEDLPSHEAHFIEGPSNLIAAMNWLLLLDIPTKLMVPSVLYQMREQIRAQLARLKDDSDQTGSALKLDDFKARVDRLAEAWDIALEETRGRENDELRAQPLSEAIRPAIRDGINAGRDHGFPRRLLGVLGRSRTRDDAVFADRSSSSAWVPKIFLVDNEVTVRSDDMLVRSLLHDLERREARQLWIELRRVAEIVPAMGSTSDRIAVGVDRLRARDRRPTAVFTTVKTHLWRDARYEPRAGESPGADGSFAGLDVFMLPYQDTEDVFVVDLDGVDEQVRRLGEDLVELQAREATAKETAEHFSEGASESRRDVYVILTATESYQFEVDPAAVVRIVKAAESELDGVDLEVAVDDDLGGGPAG